MNRRGIVSRAFVLWGGALALFGLMQLARPVRRNARIQNSQTVEAQLNPPPAVAAILMNSCRDCHTERTHWRWYSNIAPVLWLMAADVYDGRQHMDLSRWGLYSRAQQIDRLQGMCKRVRNGTMPLWYYQPLHPGARLSGNDVNALCAWTETAVRQLQAPETGNAAAGAGRPNR